MAATGAKPADKDPPPADPLAKIDVEEALKDDPALLELIKVGCFVVSYVICVAQAHFVWSAHV